MAARPNIKSPTVLCLRLEACGRSTETCREGPESMGLLPVIAPQWKQPGACQLVTGDQNVVCPHYGILFSYEKERGI